MELALIVGIGAFIILGAMFALLWASSRRDEAEDIVTQEIIVKANTATVVVQPTQEEED
ncbi:membrane protein [Microbacterium phage Zooman]|nr:membrane protein [Microbacterium phage Zooman]UDL16583.1 membrane protein [Microbacterium phage Zooman]